MRNYILFPAGFITLPVQTGLEDLYFYATGISERLFRGVISVLLELSRMCTLSVVYRSHDDVGGFPLSITFHCIMVKCHHPSGSIF